MPASPPIRVVCAVIARDDGRILMARRATGQHLAGHWELPGGKVEADETMAAALARELREELGLEVDVGPELARSLHHGDRGSIELIALAATAHNEVGTLTVHDAVTWIDHHDRCAQPIAPADIPLLQAIFEAEPLSPIRRDGDRHGRG